MRQQELLHYADLLQGGLDARPALSPKVHSEHRRRRRWEEGLVHEAETYEGEHHQPRYDQQDHLAAAETEDQKSAVGAVEGRVVRVNRRLRRVTLQNCYPQKGGDSDREHPAKQQRDAHHLE